MSVLCLFVSVVAVFLGRLAAKAYARGGVGVETPPLEFDILQKRYFKGSV